MLLNFSIENYKSYRDKTDLTMIKAPRIRDLSYSLLKEKVKNKEFNVLSSSVLYGPNASGKSNIIDAMNTLKHIVLRGSIKNTSIIGKNPNAQSNLELIPFIFDKGTPINFKIEFIYNKFHYLYELSINVGEFLSDNSIREVVFEKLEINFEKIFVREKNNLSYLNRIKNCENDFIEDIDNEKIKNMFNDTLVEDSIFLTNGFKNISKKFSQEIIKWFETSLIIIPNLEDAFSLPIFENSNIYVDGFVNSVAKQSGISGSKIVYIKDKSSRTVTTSSIKKEKNSSQEVFVPVDVVESFGTVRIIQLMPIILQVLKTGSTLVVDELDCSLHPMVMMNIINLFHNDEVNINKAQLIFNTHNPIYLNKSIFRRDEIKFVEKDLDNHISSLYSLSDFGTKGNNSVRNTTDYLKNYFMNKYGAIIDIDYTEIFKEAIKGVNNEKRM